MWTRCIRFQGKDFSDWSRGNLGQRPFGPNEPWQASKCAGGFTSSLLRLTASQEIPKAHRYEMVEPAPAIQVSRLSPTFCRLVHTPHTHTPHTTHTHHPTPPHTTPHHPTPPHTTPHPTPHPTPPHTPHPTLPNHPCAHPRLSTQLSSLPTSGGFGHQPCVFLPGRSESEFPDPLIHLLDMN